MRAAAARGEALGLSEDELAFYDTLGVNDSAVRVLGDETCATSPASWSSRTPASLWLFKPQSNRTSQVVVHGRAASTLDAGDFLKGRSRLVAPVLESFERLAGAFDLVIVEGAGSVAETNLRARDIANMGFARRAEVPVCLLADIDRGCTRSSGVPAGRAGVGYDSLKMLEDVREWVGIS